MVKFVIGLIIVECEVVCFEVVILIRGVWMFIYRV